MTRDQISREIHKRLGSKCGIEFGDTYVVVTPPDRMYTEWSVDYDSLESLTKSLGTTSMSFAYSSGWVGTEVTPGDSAELRLIIYMTVTVSA